MGKSSPSLYALYFGPNLLLGPDDLTTDLVDVTALVLDGISSTHGFAIPPKSRTHSRSLYFRNVANIVHIKICCFSVGTKKITSLPELFISLLHKTTNNVTLNTAQTHAST